MAERLMSKEEKCPNPECGSEDVERTGGSSKLQGYDEQISFKCNQCGTHFGIFKHNLKP